MQHGETIAAAVGPSSPRSKEAGPVPGMRQPRGATRGMRYRRLPFPAVRTREMWLDPSAQNIRQRKTSDAFAPRSRPPPHNRAAPQHHTVLKAFTQAREEQWRIEFGFRNDYIRDRIPICRYYFGIFHLLFSAARMKHILATQRTRLTARSRTHEKHVKPVS
jgi:hypothetical protein